MDTKGNLHIEDEFNKAKRNLLWFCSFAILLWLVHVPADGTLEPPMLGGTARLDMTWLRALAWMACVYCLVGFYRQSKNVDRLNSVALYTTEFENIRTRLTNLGEVFSSLIDKSNELLQLASPVKFLPTPDLEAAPSRLLAQIQIALSETDDLVKKIDPFGPTSDEAINQLRMTWQSAQRGIELAVNQEFRSFKEAHGDNTNKLSGLANIGQRGFLAITAIQDIQAQFHKLSDQIRGEHRFLYTWYDKYLSYMMFFFATVASSWEVIRVAPRATARAMDPIAGWLVAAPFAVLYLAIAVAALYLVYWTTMEARARLIAWKAKKWFQNRAGEDESP